MNAFFSKTPPTHTHIQKVKTLEKNGQQPLQQPSSFYIYTMYVCFNKAVHTMYMYLSKPLISEFPTPVHMRVTTLNN